jgi:methyl-accepting chemotaxis protein-3 (ribose and galactose sensor receptor)
MNKALIRLEAVTEHNASLVQQANSSALQLKEESGELSELVGRFRVDGQAASRAMPPAASQSARLPAPRRGAAALKNWE